MNYYELLNVKETASNSEIKKSYKALVKKYHPDVYDGNKSFAENKIKELNQAYEILSDQVSRAEYDRILNSVREETSKIYTNYNSDSTNINDYDDYYEKQKEELEKRYNEMYNYDYYKRYTTNYYGVDKSSDNYNIKHEDSSTIGKAKSTVHNFVSHTQTKTLLIILALLLLIRINNNNISNIKSKIFTIRLV